MKIVLAYSGGLDTSVLLSWIKDTYGNAEMIAFCANIGQEDELKGLDKKARRTGASKIYIDDLQEEFARDFIFPMLRAGAIYEGQYFLGTSIARPLIAKRMVEIAKAEKADAIAHGATGKGNDQVRFELTAAALAPDLQIIAPWRDKRYRRDFPGRQEMIDYCAAKGIPVQASAKKPYSMDRNLLHISYEAGILEDPWLSAPDEIFERMIHPTKAPDQVERFIIHWESGVPAKVSEPVVQPETREGVSVKLYESGKVLAEGLEPVFNWIDAAAARNGVGSLGMVETRYVGMKSRGEYHAPGHTVLLHAHRDIEGLCLTGSLILEKDRRSPDFAALVYNGYWFDPVCASHRAFVAGTQKFVTGETRVVLYKGNVITEGRRSPFSLYDPNVATMDGENEAYRQEDARGFIRLHALPLRVRRKVQGPPEGA
jgi:argininosuccinate synthase